jgi:hypothetical protein
MLKSTLFLGELLENKDRKFGSAKHYYPAVIVTADGEEKKALFTHEQIADSMRRACQNPEDFPKETLFDLLMSVTREVIR